MRGYSDHVTLQVAPFCAGNVARRTRGTGYIANQRPTLYYTSQMDHHDNPDMM